MCHVLVPWCAQRSLVFERAQNLWILSLNIIIIIFCRLSRVHFVALWSRFDFGISCVQCIMWLSCGFVYNRIYIYVNFNVNIIYSSIVSKRKKKRKFENVCCIPVAQIRCHTPLQILYGALMRNVFKYIYTQHTDAWIRIFVNSNSKRAFGGAWNINNCWCVHTDMTQVRVYVYKYKAT